jgi:hypothetical protein
MAELDSHSIELTLPQYAEFRSILKRRVALYENRVPMFWMDDVELDDRGEILRFRMSGMPQHENTIDVQRNQYGDKIILLWKVPKLARWNYYLIIPVLVFQGFVVSGMNDLKWSAQSIPLAFLLAFPLWIWFVISLRRSQISAGAAMLKKSLDDAADLARKTAPVNDSVAGS